MSKIAVILSGSGYLDGSEIREAVGVLWALSRAGAEAECFAPDIVQRDVVDHLTGEPVAERREVLVESARIARGSVSPLAELRSSEFDALIMPGGFGAAKNHSSFAHEGSSGNVLPELGYILHQFHEEGKPIGAICIAPAVLALAFPGLPLELTVGAIGDASMEIEKLGHTHIATQAHEIHVDREHRIVTTPAYMYDDAQLADVFEGIKSLVDEVILMTSNRSEYKKSLAGA
ncbi:MAG: isoprenoid biosynthesis glyoxalase ElbB [Bacteroidota bacterium]|nr:isoprenoid biosynthesis glyoxalase ElbB [Bacteroidota bacterium]MDP4233048.1 isoprenoid biosynthesis glyoxalase ElbB [Bacteroidota bacterium]MDP4241807.1 isoprenoid biosynthesis glyoxalase ElbB [Bacteroidota bacterium]MDP4288772.1 isoprenoid biosynthesis glyoxalase ElbB [Bacteroidota bacterium]